MFHTLKYFHPHTCCTFTPPSQVQCHGISTSVCDAAKRLGGDKVRPALELVGCAEEVERAIKYTFGTTFVCQVWTMVLLSC